MKPLFMLAFMLFFSTKGFSQLKIGIDTTRKYQITPPSFNKKTDFQISESEKRNQDNMPIKKTSGNMPNAPVDSTMKIPNVMRKN